MVSTAGLEPARVSPHAPQTCTYTDSVTSTNYQSCRLARIPILAFSIFELRSKPESYVDKYRFLLSPVLNFVQNRSPTSTNYQSCRLARIPILAFSSFELHSKPESYVDSFIYHKLILL